MHHPHHPSTGEDPQVEADQVVDDVWAQMPHINTLALWGARYSSKISELREDLTSTRAELALAHQENTYWRRNRALDAGLDPDQMPPAGYLEAVRTPQREPYRAVAVQIDGADWVVGLRRDRPFGMDLMREMRDWQELVAIVREVRTGLAGGA